MRVSHFLCAALIAALVPAAANADDPNDPAMRSPAARARDRAIIRELNLREAARVQARDARWARQRQARNDEYASRLDDHEHDMASYRSRRAQYERDMADWRRAVAACRGGDWSACD